MSQIKPGIYQATISNYGIGVTQNGNPQVMILFNFQDHENAPREMTWYGSLKEGKAQEYTLKTLLYCGFSGSDPAEIADGIESGLLDHITPVKITVEEHEYEGKKSMRVSWVNKIGSKAMEKRITKSEAKLKLGTLNLKGTLAAVRQETGIKAEPRPAKAAVGQNNPPQPEPGWDDFDPGF